MSRRSYDLCLNTFKLQAPRRHSIIMRHLRHYHYHTEPSIATISFEVSSLCRPENRRLTCPETELKMPQDPVERRAPLQLVGATSFRHGHTESEIPSSSLKHFARVGTSRGRPRLLGVPVDSDPELAGASIPSRLRMRNVCGQGQQRRAWTSDQSRIANAPIGPLTSCGVLHYAFTG